MRTGNLPELCRSLSARRVRSLAVAAGMATAIVGVAPAAAFASTASHHPAAGTRAAAVSRMTLAHAPAALRIAAHRALSPLVDPQKAEWNDGSTGGYFGNSVAISGATAVVGAEAANSSTGAAYVFVRSTTGTWSQQAVLTAGDGVAGDRFGDAVAITGTTTPTVVVGAFARNTQAGAAYVFTRSGTTWSQKGELTATDHAANDAFGSSVAIAGSYVVVGASGWGGAGPGHAYIFKHNAKTGKWAQQTEFNNPDATSGDYFGNSVSITGTTAVVAADGTSSSAGTVYVYALSGGVWAPQQTITDSTAGDAFGSSVAIAGGAAPFMIIGAAGTSSGAGAAYVYIRSGTTWSLQQPITDSTAGDNFGSSAAITVQTTTAGLVVNVLVGVDNYNSGAGTAAVLSNSGGNWHVQGQLSASDGAAGDAFGDSVGLSGTSALVGALGHNSYAGAAYLYKI